MTVDEFKREVEQLAGEVEGFQLLALAIVHGPDDLTTLASTHDLAVIEDLFYQAAASIHRRRCTNHEREH